jgi:protein O-GlcNAc transferase
MDSRVQTSLQRAVALHGQGQVAEASRLYADLLRSDPANPDALHLLGVTHIQLGNAQAGLDCINESLRINPQQPAAIANRGNALLALERVAEALASYDVALAQWPEYPLAHYGRGNALSALGQPTDALASFDRALELNAEFLQAHLGRGGVLLKLGRFTESLAAHERSVGLSPRLPQAHLGCASALLGLKAHDQALVSVDRALQLNPNFAEAFTEKGHVLAEQRRNDAAVQAYDRALQLNPRLATAWFGRGLVLSMQTRFAEAADSFERALDINPQHPYAQGAALNARLQVCDWSLHAARIADIEAAMERAEPVDFPFSYLAVNGSPARQLQCARRFASLQNSGQRLPPAGERESRRRIRVAYISSDFLEHPTSYLLAGIFEKHDREHFEIIGISLREDTSSSTAHRVKAAFDRVVMAEALADHELARLIRDLDVDIAVDLMGYTGEHRAPLFSYRPSPIQVNYLGFPATMGNEHIDYLIADEHLIPQSHRVHYDEHIAYLPECFQANDDRRPIGSTTPSRAQMGLPASGFVWSSFHSSYKLNPPMFDIWMRLLRAVPDSVLWLLGGNALIQENLCREAFVRGVSADRLIFASSLPYPEHLARLALADLCLDTLPFNGGTTTSDALWAGLPVLTCAGDSFAARMSGSLLRAVGLPELVTDSMQAYEEKALELASAPGLLDSLRDKLAQGRTSHVLFDTDRFRRHLEAAYSIMVERHRSGLAPITFTVPAVPRSVRHPGTAAKP